MSGVGGILKHYNAYFERAVGILRRRNYNVAQGTSLGVRTERSGEVTIFTRDTIYFREWPLRKGSSQKIDILATVKEGISPSDMRCVRSTVCVDYFRLEGGGRAVAMESYHYDFEDPPQARHPICHAHSSGKPLCDRPDSFSAKRTPEIGRMGERCRDVRIPTAFVNLPGLFAILASNHMASEHWQEFAEAIGEQPGRFPRVTHPCVERAGNLGLSAWGWY